MAFLPKDLSGYTGGSGKAPGIFTYVTNDSIADVTTEGYWNDLKAGLGLNDVIFAVVHKDTAPQAKALVCNLAHYVDGLGFNTKTALMGVFVGDDRATDEPGYQSDNFGGNIGAGSVQRLFTYRNNTDLMATIAAVSYFDELAFALTVGDIFFVASNDGSDFIRVESIIDGVVTTTVVAFV